MSQKNQEPESWSHLIDETPGGGVDHKVAEQIKAQAEAMRENGNMNIRLAVLEAFVSVAGIYVSPIAGPDEIKKTTIETLAMFEDYVRHGVAS